MTGGLHEDAVRWIAPEEGTQLQERWDRYLATMNSGRPDDAWDDFVLMARLGLSDVSGALRRWLYSFGRFGNDDGVALVRNVPTDDHLPQTPADSRRSQHKVSFRSEFGLLSLASALGEPIAYAQEKGGQLVQEVCPTPQNEREWSSESSSELLPFHTEAAFHPHIPSYVVLVCLRADRDDIAETQVASVRRAAPLLSADVRVALSRPEFETGIDFSFGAPTGRRGGGLVTPVLFGDLDDPFLRYDPGLMKPRSERAARAMAELDRVLRDVTRSIRLRAGDWIAIDNRRAVHARTKFTARYDGFDRWLHRVYLVDGLAPSAAVRRDGGRVINESFGG